MPAQTIKKPRFRHALLASLVAAAAVAGVTRATWASDHQDAPSLLNDPGADIADVFAFMNPTAPTRMVLAMTVNPNAQPGATFPVDIDYTFQLTGYDVNMGLNPGLANVAVTCRFLAPQAGSQKVLCQANGFSALGNVGEVDASASEAPIRIFAGLRADPAFGDTAKLQDTLGQGKLAFVDAGGTNTFAGKNVLALVVDVDLDRVVFLDNGGGVDAGDDSGDAGDDGGDAGILSAPPPVTHPLLAVSATAVRP